MLKTPRVLLALMLSALLVSVVNAQNIDNTYIIPGNMYVVPLSDDLAIQSAMTELKVSMAPTPTPQQVWTSRVKNLNPSLRKYIRKLYADYNQNAWQYQHKGVIQKYIIRMHTQSEKVFHYYKDPEKYSDVVELTYASLTYPDKWGIDTDWMISLWTQESGYVNCIGDMYDHTTHKANPPSAYSIGIGQVGLDSAKGNLESRGIDTTGLTYDDLLYYRLMNMDVSASIAASKVRRFGLKHGIMAYNAGDYSWRDGRSNHYYKCIKAIHDGKAEWN